MEKWIEISENHMKALQNEKLSNSHKDVLWEIADAISLFKVNVYHHFINENNEVEDFKWKNHPNDIQMRQISKGT